MKKIILTILFVYLSFGNAFALEKLNSNGVSFKIETIFENYTKKLEKKYTKNQTTIKIRELENKVDTIIDNKSLDKNKKIILNSLLKLSREYLNKYEQERKALKLKYGFNKYDISNYFRNKTLSKNHIFLEDGIWYTYYFQEHLSFPKGVTPTKRDLEYNKISQDFLLFIKDDGSLGFVKDYQKVKLISDNIIYGIPDKNNFLSEVRDDKLYLRNNNSDLTFIDIKNSTEKLIKNINTQEEKTQLIYNYILENINYTQEINLEDKKIFSGIQTYKNNDGVCEGYVKLFQYMLQFAGIDKVESIRGFVIDAQDYPQIGHAWTRIGKHYYDPTFDDPIGQTETKSFNQYKYYKLPKDLFYTNRYNYSEPNKSLEKAPMNYRKLYIQKNLVDIYPKYKSSNYKILDDIKFRTKYKFDNYKELTTQDLFNKIDFVNVENFKVKESGKNIKTLNYFDLESSSNISDILEQINYDFEKYTLIKWIDNGTTMYRIGFDIQYHNQ